LESLPTGIESELALIIREAITNVIRHAETEKVWIVLKQVATHLTLTISDQGQITTIKEQSGMQNMRTRINQIGGEMNVVNTPNTQLKFTLPIPEKSKNNELISTMNTITNG
jgi:two-component system sensor histidine kinase DesK